MAVGPWHRHRQAAARTKQPGEKGFIGSLFDFSFKSMVTPKIIKVLYVLFTLWTALVGLIILVIGFRTGGMAGGLFTLIVVEPIFLLLDARHLPRGARGVHGPHLPDLRRDEADPREHPEGELSGKFFRVTVIHSRPRPVHSADPSVRWLIGLRCPQPSAPGEGVFHSSGPVTHMVIHRTPGVRYLSRGTESSQ